ncbi:MAG: methyltransferase [Eubacteriales bacterium]|nr:methyltransferase [Eubacteriales bacterium]
MSEFIELWENGPLFKQAEHFRLSTDSVLLSDYVNLSSVKKGFDLGCASGIIALLLLERSEKLCMTGLEINENACALAHENMERNGFDGRCEIVCGDIREHRRLFAAGSFDLVVSNPPYFPVGSGVEAPDAARAAARGEGQCTLDELCRAAAFLLKTGGSFTLVHRCERLSELFCSMTESGIEPKRLRLVQHKAASAPSLVLVEGRRGGKPGLRIEPPLILAADDGSETEEYKRIYRRN